MVYYAKLQEFHAGIKWAMRWVWNGDVLKHMEIDDIIRF